MTRSLAVSFALALAGCNVVFGLDEAEPRDGAGVGVGPGGGGGDGGSTAASTGGLAATTSSTGGGPPTGAGGEGGASAATSTSTSTGGGGGEPCPIVHELVETFEDADPVWEELYGSFSLILDEEQGGSILRIELDGTAEMRTWPFDPPWSLRTGDTLELSARSRGVEGTFTSASLAVGDGASQGLTHVVDLARSGQLTPTSRVMTAEYDVEDARVWLEVGALEAAIFDVDDVIVRIRRCP